MAFLGGTEVKNLSANEGNAGDTYLIPGLGTSPGGGNGSPVHYSYLENPMDSGAWQATVHGVAKSWTRLSDFIFFLSIVPFGEGNGNPLQDSCLGNLMDSGAWQATVHGLQKTQT